MVSSGIIIDKNLVWLLVWGRGVKKYDIHYPNENLNKNLVLNEITRTFCWEVGVNHLSNLNVRRWEGMLADT